MMHRQQRDAAAQALQSSKNDGCTYSKALLLCRLNQYPQHDCTTAAADGHRHFPTNVRTKCTGNKKYGNTVG